MEIVVSRFSKTELLRRFDTGILKECRDILDIRLSGSICTQSKRRNSREKDGNVQVARTRRHWPSNTRATNLHSHDDLRSSEFRQPFPSDCPFARTKDALSKATETIRADIASSWSVARSFEGKRLDRLVVSVNLIYPAHSPNEIGRSRVSVTSSKQKWLQSGPRLNRALDPRLEVASWVMTTAITRDKRG